MEKECSMFPTMPDGLKEPILTENAKIAMAKRYLIKDLEGNPVETPKQLLWRVAYNVAESEGKYDDSLSAPKYWAKIFYEMMAEGKFFPNSPTLMNAGKPNGQLSACFVLPVGDSIEEIFDAIKFAAMIHKSGGGTGFSFTRLRPANSAVASTGGIASGPLSFLKIFDTATEQIKQGGTRRGANMGILRVDHPDIIDFIKSKEVDGVLSNFNLSVGITEEFMDAVQDFRSIDLVCPHTKKVVRSESAMKIYNLIIDRAWRTGEPGIVFLDRINRDNPTPEQGEIEATNPCGEQPLLPYEACNLGSINLSKFSLVDDIPYIINGKKFYERPEYEKYKDLNDRIDWKELSNTVHYAIRFLDDVIDANSYPLPQITEAVLRNRKIGLGVMGFADLLFSLHIPYDSGEALNLANQIMAFIQIEANKASANLSQARGVYPAFDKNDPVARLPMRNATRTTIAPTGTLSIFGDCSSGIEPLFALAFVKHILNGEEFTVVNPYFLRDIDLVIKEEGMKPEMREAIIDEAITKGSIQQMLILPKWFRETYVTAMDISPSYHLLMQAEFQKFTDNAVSKTVNLPNSATKDDVENIFNSAFKLGCKGVTLYRDGCRADQVLTAGSKKKEEPKTETPIEVGKGIQADNSRIEKVNTYRQRPETIKGFTTKITTGLGTMYVTVNEVDERPFEVFATIGKSGRSITAKAEAVGRLVSLALRSGIELEDIISQIKGIGGEHPAFREKGMVLSIPDAIAKVLEDRYLHNKKVEVHAPQLQAEICPDCGNELIFQEGCSLCHACGYSKCS